MGDTVKVGGSRQTTPVLLVLVGLLACAAAEYLGFRDLVTIAVATNAAGLALLTQNHMQIANKNGGVTNVLSKEGANSASNGEKER